MPNASRAVRFVAPSGPDARSTIGCRPRNGASHKAGGFFPRARRYDRCASAAISGSDLGHGIAVWKVEPLPMAAADVEVAMEREFEFGAADGLPEHRQVDRRHALQRGQACPYVDRTPDLDERTGHAAYQVDALSQGGDPLHP